MRILVIDAFPDSGETLCEVLKLRGHAVCCVHSGAEALASAPGFRPKLVISEIVLPGMDGFTLAHRLRAALGYAPRFTGYTGYLHADVTERAQTAGFEQVFPKPYVQPLLEMVALASMSHSLPGAELFQRGT